MRCQKTGISKDFCNDRKTIFQPLISKPAGAKNQARRCRAIIDHGFGDSGWLSIPIAIPVAISIAIAITISVAILKLVVI